MILAVGISSVLLLALLVCYGVVLLIAKLVGYKE